MDTKSEEVIEKEEIREDFCPSCLAVPLAFAGVGASAYGSQTNGGDKNKKKVFLYIGIGSFILALLIWIYFKKIKKCYECGDI